MKRILSALLTVLVISSCSMMTQSQSTTSGSKTKGGKMNSGTSGSQSGTGASSSSSSSSTNLLGLSNEQVVAGLKEALSIGATNSSTKLSITDAFFRNMAIKILMPKEAQDVEAKLRQLGMGKMVDDAILSMNRAAESAARDAAPIFLDAIKSMSFSDAVGIVTGSQDAATQYLKTTTSAQLTTKFKPVIEGALKKTNATRYWNDVFSNYNKLPFVTDVNPDLTAYVTQKALDGLFYTLAQEEAQIRQNPAQTASDLITDIFGKKK